MSVKFNEQKVEEIQNEHNILNQNNKQVELTNEYMKSIKHEPNNYNKLKELYDKDYVDINNNLYPTFNDPNFNIKIANKTEFSNTQYPDIKAEDVEEYKEKVKELSQAKFELAPHQLFVKNFLSFETPYNSLLLYHGLGSGKTCSAIGVAEDMRVYLQQMNIPQKILIVASPNVQENFKLQLFDERKLKKNNGVWNLEGCTSNKLLKEINPTSIEGLTKEKIVSLIKNIIKTFYYFMGYTKFSLMIDKIEASLPKVTKKSFRKKIQSEFNNRLIIIDEIHNIRTSSSIDNKKIVKSLFKLVQNASNMKLLVLSATPMYNDYKEIIWLLNLMNLNDNKSEILLNDVFDKNGDFIVKDGIEIGKQKLIEKTRGYVSFIRGENPYTFPHRIFPSQFSKKTSFIGDLKYPIYQINGKDISSEPMKIIDTYQLEIGSYQELGYNYLTKSLISNENRELMENNKEGFGYNILQKPLQALNMVYPCELLDNLSNDTTQDNDDTRDDNGDDLIESDVLFTGKNGLLNVIDYTENTKSMLKYNYTYKEGIVEKYGRIFSHDTIQKYSPKIYEICKHIINSKGIVLVYSQYIDGGLIPMALALEELGFERYGKQKSLISKESKKKANIFPIDSLTNKKIESTTTKSNKSSYSMITGDMYHSHSNIDEVNAATNENNTNGEKLKVILLSKAGSEGIDFKNVRSVHIMDPWYNMNRIEQIIGRGVRNSSHINLDIEKRNTSIFLYGTLLKNKEIESIDNYIYRVAEKKAIQMGKITRLLKENSVDCLLNIKQKNFILDNMNNIHIEQILSNDLKIQHEIGDKPYSSTCDYMNNCDYKCIISKDDQIDYINDFTKEENKITFNENFINQNIEPIIEKIKTLFSSKYFYHKHDIIKEINVYNAYTLEEINYALNKLSFNKSEITKDKYEFNGYIVNVGKYYYYQPLELNDPEIALFNRNIPIDVKNNKIKLTLDIDKEVEVIPTLTNSVNFAEKGNHILKELLDNMDTDYKKYKSIMVNELQLSEEDKKIEIQRIQKELKDNSRNNHLSKDEESNLEQKINNLKDTSSFYLLFKIFNKLNYKDEDLLLIYSQYSFDYLSFEEKGNVINYLYNTNTKTTLEEYLFNYINNTYVIEHTNEQYIVFENKGELGFYKKTINENNNTIWIEGEPYLNDLLETSTKQKYLYETETIVNQFSKYIGYLSNIHDKKNNSNILKFKLKFMKTTKGSGFLCETYQKQFKLELINNFLFEDVTEDILSDSYIKGKPKQICMLIEIFFRYFDYIKKSAVTTTNGKEIIKNKWFLNPIETIVNKKYKQLIL